MSRRVRAHPSTHTHTHNLTPPHPSPPQLWGTTDNRDCCTPREGSFYPGVILHTYNLDQDRSLDKKVIR